VNEMRLLSCLPGFESCFLFTTSDALFKNIITWCKWANRK